MSRTILIVLVTVGCGGPGYLDGVGFDVGDAIYQTVEIDDSRQVTTVVISDAVNLCDRTTLAGHRELRIRQWDGGSVEVELRKYDDDCSILDNERAVQSWVDVEAAGHGQVDLNVVFRTASKNVSGQINAQWCDLPEEHRIGCE